MPIRPEHTTLSPEESTLIRGCTPNEMLMINEYFKNGYNKAAAIRSVGKNSRNSQRTFGTPAVKAEIQRRLRHRDSTQKDREKKFSVTEEEIMAEMCKIAFAPLETAALILKARKEGKEVLTPEIEELSENQKRFGATQSVAARDKKAALDSLAKVKGMFIEKIEITGDSLESRLIRGQKRIAAGGSQDALDE